MKILVTSILFFMFFISYAEDMQILRVKYDENYYAPIIDVSKWDLALALQDKSKYFINVSLTKNQNVIFNETFLIDKSNIQGSIYFARAPLTAIFIDPKIKRNLMTGITVIINGKNKSITSIIPYQNLQMVIKKQSALKLNQKTAIMELKNNFKYSNKCSPKIMKKYILGISKKNQTENFSMQLYVTIVEKNTNSSVISVKKIPIEKLLITQKEITKTRDQALEKYKAGRITLEEVNKIQTKLIQINSALAKRKNHK